jgi:electron transfer flavoprotein alpha subunit
VLVWSERDDLSRELLHFAGAHRGLLGPAYAAVFGERATARAEAYRSGEAVCTYVSESVDSTDEALALGLARLAEHLQIQLVLLGGTRRGRAIAPRLAQILGAGCVSEAVELAVEDGQLISSRYTLGGNTLARERILTDRKVIAAVPGAALGPEGAAGGDAEATAGTGAEQAEPVPAAGELLPLPFQPSAGRARVLRREPKPSAGADLAGSERLVCIGRGLERAEDLPLIQDLAEALGAELACTRPLSYEYGWLPEERMLGISGLRPSPRLMLSLGVSGQVQHTVGIMGSKLIVAVNREASAPIFRLADYGIVGDLYQVAPKLTERLRRRSRGRGSDRT